MKGRVFGRSPSHRKALLRNLASSLVLTERDADLDDALLRELPNRLVLKLNKLSDNLPDVSGRVVTTLAKAKEVRPLVEKCVTIARQSLAAEENARQYATDAERDSEEWKAWRQSDRWQQWNRAMAPAVAGRRRVLKLLGDKVAVWVLFRNVAPKFADRQGGYTRIMRLADPRVGDAGQQVILEFVGRNDRVARKSERPQFRDEEDEQPEAAEQQTAVATATAEAHPAQADEQAAEEQPAAEQQVAADAPDEEQQGQK